MYALDCNCFGMYDGLLTHAVLFVSNTNEAFNMHIRILFLGTCASAIDFSGWLTPARLQRPISENVQRTCHRQKCSIFVTRVDISLIFEVHIA